MADQWYDEFRRRITWALSVDHFRHGFVGTIEVEDHDGYDPTFSGDSYESMSITISGKCPCGQDVWATSDGAIESAELIRKVTSAEIVELMNKDTNPFESYETGE